MKLDMLRLFFLNVDKQEEVFSSSNLNHFPPFNFIKIPIQYDHDHSSESPGRSASLQCSASRGPAEKRKQCTTYWYVTMKRIL